ncbi:MAG: crossover junction endodeoxyribonuclease RuvC [Thermodesulfobacteriota bacterium]
MPPGTRTGLRILGLDPGSRATGYGVIDLVGHKLVFVACGVVRPPAEAAFAERLRRIHDGLVQVIAEHTPDEAAVEDVFVAANPRSALKLGHARGVAMIAAMGRELAVHEYGPRQIKQAVVGYGLAGKEQMQRMVRLLLSLAALPSQDAADALAVAICHAHHGGRLPPARTAGLACGRAAP